MTLGLQLAYKLPQSVFVTSDQHQTRAATSRAVVNPIPDDAPVITTTCSLIGLRFTFTITLLCLPLSASGSVSFCKKEFFTQSLLAIERTLSRLLDVAGALTVLSAVTPFRTILYALVEQPAPGERQHYPGDGKVRCTP